MIDYDRFSRCHLTDIFFRFSRGSKSLKDYLVVVVYYSKDSELLPLLDKTTSFIVEQSKSMFACHGIRIEIVGDNMPFL